MSHKLKLGCEVFWIMFLSTNAQYADDRTAVIFKITSYKTFEF